MDEDRPPRGVTEMLRAWGAGNKEALDRLTDLVYKELRRMVHRYPCPRFACRLTTAGARLDARMKSLFLSCRALASPAKCRFIQAVPDTFSSPATNGK